jgi:hypothetical protein
VLSHIAANLTVLFGVPIVVFETTLVTFHPDSDKLPLTVIAPGALYTDAVPAGSVTLNVSVLLPVPDPFVAVSTTEKLPVSVGCPLITPVDIFTLKPDGKPVAPKLVGLFVAVMVKL